MSIKMRLTASSLCLLILLAGPILGQQAQPPSVELDSFIAQIRQVYIVSKGMEFDIVARQYPHALAGMIGHALWQQEGYARLDPRLGPSLEKLKGELQVYLANLAQYCNYIDANGIAVSADSLSSSAKACMGPEGENLAFQHFAVRNGEMPNILVVPQTGSVQTGSVSGKGLQGENAIQLLGHDAPPVNSSGLTPTFSDMGPGKYLPKDTILGAWEEVDQYKTEPPAFLLQVTKEGDIYVGSCASILDPTVFHKRYQFGPGQVLFKVKHDTWVTMSTKPEECPISYEGEGLAAEGNPGQRCSREIRVWKENDGLRLAILRSWPSRFNGFRKVGQ